MWNFLFEYKHDSGKIDETGDDNILKAHVRLYLNNGRADMLKACVGAVCDTYTKFIACTQGKTV